MKGPGPVGPAANDGGTPFVWKSGWNFQGALGGPNGEAADHPSLSTFDKELVAFDYATPGGPTSVSVQHWDNDWVVETTLAPSATTGSVEIASGQWDELFIADNPASPHVYSYEGLDDDSWLADASAPNASGAPMVNPKMTACWGGPRKYLAYQVGLDIYVEWLNSSNGWVDYTNTGKVAYANAATFSDITLRDIHCGSSSDPYSYIEPILVFEAVPTGQTQRVIMTYEANEVGPWIYDDPITAPNGLDALDPAVTNSGSTAHLAYRVPGPDNGIQVLSHELDTKPWTAVGGLINAVPGQAPGAPRITEGTSPIVAFTESDGTAEAIYTYQWDVSAGTWRPYDVPIHAAAGDTLAIQGNGFGLAAEGDGEVVIAYPEDTPNGRRIFVQRHHQ